MEHEGGDGLDHGMERTLPLERTWGPLGTVISQGADPLSFWRVGKGCSAAPLQGAGMAHFPRRPPLIAVPCCPPSTPLYLSTLRLRQVLARAPALQPAPPGHPATRPAADP